VVISDGQKLEAFNTPIKLQLVYRMNLFHRHHKYECEEDGEKFASYDDLIQHARHVHHHPIMKCHLCGKEFIHEKDRLHHEREEHEKIVDYREHKNLDGHGKKTTPQDEVYEHTRNYGDNF
jgi:hypothetical protein